MSMTCAPRSPDEATPFDFCGPLPSGRLAIEASAGTGKTFTLATLATRFIAEEGVSAAELLVVTFTRAATIELRARIRDRLLQAQRYLALMQHPQSESRVGAFLAPLNETEQRILRHLGGRDLPLRHDRVERALAEFDGATIVTIHGFATQVLASLGATAGVDPDVTLVEDGRARSEEVCADILAAAAARTDAPEDLPSFDALLKATRQALNMPDVVLVPVADAPGATSADLALATLVTTSLRHIALRRRQRRVLSFDGVLTELRRALAAPGGDAIAGALRSRFKVALIDEFQDTDPIQWDIFSRLFGGLEPGDASVRTLGARGAMRVQRPEMAAAATARAGSFPLVVVGDPKQAIYSFRGADVETYLRAVQRDARTQRRVLAVNHRSDAPLLAALDTLLAGSTYGNAAIRFSSVAAAPSNSAGRLRRGQTGPSIAPLALRLTIGPELKRARNGTDLLTPEAEQAVCGDLVERIRDLLDHSWIGPRPVAPASPTGAGAPVSNPRVAEEEGGERASSRRLRPDDIAILVNNQHQAVVIQQALSAQGVPAVLARGKSVLESPAAEQWRWLLEGVARPSDPQRARAVALSWFGGRDAQWVATASDEDLARLQEQLAAWAQTLASGRIADFVEQVRAETGVLPRVLALPDGDRAATDLEHIGELLHAASATGRASISGLQAALATEPVADADAEIDGDTTARRVETDAKAVQIMTVWVSKGLEFPVVCCPFLWRKRRATASVVYHDPVSDQRTYDLADGRNWPDDAGAKQRRKLATQEAAGEDLRLLYVALTRARHHLLVWWARTQDSNKTALARVLFARSDGAIDPVAYAQEAVTVPPDDALLSRLRCLHDRSEGAIVPQVHGKPERTMTPWVDPEHVATPPELALGATVPDVDRSAARWSFTMINQGAQDATFHRDAQVNERGEEQRGGNDEFGATEAETQGEDDAWTMASSHAPDTEGSNALTRLPAGAAFGTLVHAVLEELDFTAVGRDDHALAIVVEQALKRHPLDLSPVAFGHARTRAGDGELRAAPLGRQLLCEGIHAALDTPLGPLFDDKRLADFAFADRINELSFDLLLGQEGHHPSTQDIGALLVHHLDRLDPLRPWAVDLASGALGPRLSGHLTGSIDLVLRIRHVGAPEQFVVVDYKTNRLSPPGVASTPDHYAMAAMTEAMTAHDYPLQALLYTVALHRYLRWRLRDYNPSHHLGGAAYLFLRGMTRTAAGIQDQTPPAFRPGVFVWQLPPAAIEELSALLDGQRCGNWRLGGKSL